MTEFLVYRKGSNSMNQPSTFEAIPIAIVEAENADKAAETTWGDEKPNVHGCPSLAAEVLVSCGNLDVWANQHVYAVPKDEAPDEDVDALFEQASFAKAFHNDIDE